MSATSNSKDLVRDLKDLVRGFGFDLTTEGGSLGRDVAGIVADGIAARSVDEEMGENGPWPVNEPKYAAWKERRYGVRGTNRRTGNMLSLEALLGQTSISTHEVQMLYGVGRAPTRSATGMGFDPKTDGEITDIEKAFWATQAGRDFYFLDDTISDAVFDRIAECCEQYLVKETF